MFIKDYGEYIKKVFYPNGKIKYEKHYKHGKLHNKKGPAVREWYSNGKLFIEKYFVNGKLHNPKGPACRYWCGETNYCKKYWLEGKEVDKSILEKSY